MRGDNIFKQNLKFMLNQQRLIDMAMKFGLNDPRVIAQSRTVDRLIVEMQKRRLPTC